MQTLRDITGCDLGQPLAVALPETIEDVRALVERARAAGTRVVSVGRRTAYWQPLDLADAIAVDLSRMTRFSVREGVLTAEAGALVRTIDDALRREGLALPLVPDSDGGSTIGGLVATGCAAGRGMGNGTITRWLTGLTVVDGTGTVIRTGTAAMLGLPPFTRDGLPDTTSAFIGSQGSHGVIAEVHLRVVPAWHRVLVRGAASIAEILELGRTLPPLYDTFRATCEDDATWRADIFVQSPIDAEEAMRRARGLAARIRGASIDPHPPLWDAMPHEEFAKTRRLAGLDCITSYGHAAAVVGELAAAARACRRALDRRVALYLAPEYVNAGIHLAYALDDDTSELVAPPLEGVIPYRFGRTWDRARIVDGSELSRLARLYDPDGIFAAPGT